MFTQQVINECVNKAKKLLIEPAAFLAVVEVESRGRAFESDNFTPIFLFERHKFYEWLKKLAPERLDRAVKEGLAIPTWDRKNQYRDLGTSKNRLSVLTRAVAIDRECAYRACSWGVGQVMGFNCREIGFSNAVSMLKFMREGGVPAQAEVMFRFIKYKKLTDEVNSHDWARFAFQYNGSGYKQNQYDTKMAAAYDKWRRALDERLPETGTEPELEIDMPDPTQRPDKPVPPATDMLKSKTFWAMLASIFSSFMAAMSNPAVQIVFLLLIAGAAAFVIWDRRRKQREAHI